MASSVCCPHSVIARLCSPGDASHAGSLCRVAAPMLATVTHSRGAAGGQVASSCLCCITTEEAGMSTLSTLQDILVEEFNLSRHQLLPAAQLDQLGLDSLAVLEIMFKIEDRFGLNIKDDVPVLVTLNDVVVYIDTLLAKRSDPSATPAASAKAVQ